MNGKQLKPWTATFEVSPTWTEKSARKKAEAFAATFEKECKEGITTDSRQKFASYCDYVINLKEQRGIKHSTIVRYKELTKRIYPRIGHIKLKEAASRPFERFVHLFSSRWAERQDRWQTVPAKTILEHHRLISTVLEQAVKEGVVPFNVAGRASLPKKQNTKRSTILQPEQVAAIRDALEREPIKWKTLVHLLLITGARRGEVLGLKWDKVDFEGERIYICNSVLYSSDVGIYESTPKNRALAPLCHVTYGNYVPATSIPGMAEGGALAVGGILSESRFCILAGQWQAYAPRQCNRLAQEV